MLLAIVWLVPMAQSGEGPVEQVGTEVDAVGAPDLPDGQLGDLVLEQVGFQQLALGGGVFGADLPAISLDPQAVRALAPQEEVARILPAG